MDRARLAENGIFIEDGDGGCELLPPHVESLQDALLDFRRTILDKFGFTEEEILQLLDEDGINARDDIPGDDRAEISADLEFCAGVRELTNHLVQANQLGFSEYSEYDWKVQFKELLLDTLVEEAQVRDGDTRQTARAKFYYDSFQEARDRPWTLFGPDGSEGTQGDLPAPKPGWVAHFPVYVIAPAEYNHQHSGLQQFASSHSIVDNFSQVTLEHLAGHGLQPSATGVTKTGRRGATLSSEYVLFPWLIVEHMKDEYKGNAELCYSHAANAGAAALRMLENLSRHDNQSLGDIPPVVTMTIRRDLVRVWIMHSSHSKGTCEMQVIWRGSLTRMVDILELKAILENCQTWATRVLRPWISRQIDLWKQQCPDDCPRPFDASLRRRAAQSRNSSNRPTSDEDVPEKELKKNENKDVDLRQIIREEHDWLLQQLSKDPVETKRPTRSIATQTGPDDDRHPLEKSAVQPMTLNPTTPFPRGKILDPKPRLAKTTAPSGSSLSSDKGGTAPTNTRQETHGRQRKASSVDIFKNRMKVYDEKRIVVIKLPDVSSDEILAQKPWLGAKKSSEVEKQTEAALTQGSQEKKGEVEENTVEKDKAKEQDDNGTRDKDNETEGDETKAKNTYNKDDNGNNDKVDDEKEGKETELIPSLKEATEEINTGSTLTTDDKGEPPEGKTGAVPIPAEEDAKGDSNPEPLTSPKESSTYTTETTENERSSEIVKEENPEESIEVERTEEIPAKNLDEVIEKGNSEKGTEEEEKANPEKIMEEEKPEEVTEMEIFEQRAKHKNSKETIEKEDSSESVVKEKSDQNPGNMPTKLPLPTPEPEPEDPSSPNPPAPAEQLVWRKDYGQNKDDDHKELDQPTVKQDTPPPRDGVFAFGSSGDSKEPPFTFKMKTEGSAEDPRNSSIPRTQAKDARLFDWPKGDDEDGHTLSENPRPVKLIKGSGSLARTGGGTIIGEGEPEFLKASKSNTGSNPGLGNEDSQSGGGDDPTLSSSKGTDKTP
ncbi:hypothetical protein NW757_005540 [Fusarium falciforme]|nr:hypothetical protein NW757_005540 [Fusarium falciforme]